MDDSEISFSEQSDMVFPLLMPLIFHGLSSIDAYHWSICVPPQMQHHLPQYLLQIKSNSIKCSSSKLV